MDFSWLPLSNHYVSWSFFIISFAILGAGVKFIDDAFDENIYSKGKAILLAPLIGIYWAFVMSLSPASGTILAAIVFSVLFTGKIDNIAHQAGLVSIGAVLFLSGLIQILWIPLIFITLAGLVDEFGNDYVDKKRVKNNFVYYFFEYRFSMKLAVFAFAFFEFFPWLFFLAFLVWDIMYAIVTKRGTGLKHQRKFYYHKVTNGLTLLWAK